MPVVTMIAIIAAIDGMLCAKLASAPGTPRGDSNRLLPGHGRLDWPLAAAAVT